MTKEVSLKELLQELAESRAFDFRGYKRTTLERRFRRRMFQLNIGSYADYAQYIRENPEEVNEVLTTILINVTEFFRDPPAWEILRTEILPPMLKQLTPGASFRAWSAGCASGEEAYSIAITLAELLGPRLPDFDVKIYATDIDEEELVTARRGEYSAEALRRVRPEWREKYFHGKGMLRVNREIRRLLIFGRSNLAQDAPISHVDLLLCRNILIYFDSELQRQILARLDHALEVGGILFLGKSESQLTNAAHFRRLNARWRIFRRIQPDQEGEINEAAPAAPAEEAKPPLQSPELESLRLQQRYILETVRLGVLLLGPDDVIAQSNSSVLVLYGLPPINLVGKKLEETDLRVRTPELISHLQSSHLNNESSRFHSRVRVGVEDRVLEVSIQPVLNENGGRTGTFVYLYDISMQERLQTTVEELETTSEELQSANEELETTNEELQSTNEELETTNEELETTNEELQSTNEELETTNEELHSTNEELETTNEELQSLNEELETTNQELEERGKDLDQINNVYAQTLERIRVPVMLVTEDLHIAFWNAMALRLFGFRSKPPVSLQLEQLPIPPGIRNLLIRRHRGVLVKQRATVAKNQCIGRKEHPLFDVHLSLIPREDHTKNVLIMFEPRGGTAAEDGAPVMVPAKTRSQPK
jgi:two-component system, chemotaxis family, CheB/CheR fusion protein